MKGRCYCEREGLFLLNQGFFNVMSDLDSVTVPCVYHTKSYLHQVLLLPTDLTGCWSVVWLVDAAGVRMEPATFCSLLPPASPGRLMAYN